ncbi:hypothetical protein [Streptomyces sp. NBC_01217]|uniref:hypothetical protein n=1 Tax=Streptomyces sp. NBC_01217 TaxID=2903779 RepID=UPI002E162A92|nr:hypothetical protein OG507_05400 [Streptomyces sp. NBC_01217]
MRLATVEAALSALPVEYRMVRIRALRQCLRETTEAFIGGLTGALRRPQLLVLGRYGTDGRLRAVGRTTPLKPDAARRLADHLTEAGPDHPWTGARFTATWDSREPLVPTLVVPELVAQVSADTAIDRGAWRHPLTAYDLGSN